MLDKFGTADVAHAAGLRHAGSAAHEVISAADFVTARQEITRWSGYAPTPLVALDNLADKLSIAGIHYKHEGPRFGLGSFKALGGSYATFRVLQRQISKTVGHEVAMEDIGNDAYTEIAAKLTVVTATDGNHGRSVAWGAKRLGMPCRIYIHAEVSEERAQALSALGATVVRVDGDYDASVAATRQDAENNGWFIVSDTSWDGYTETPREVMAGYGVMAHEIHQVLEHAPSHVFLQGGVGGLAAAIAAALRQRWRADSPKVVVVEPELAPCLFASARAGKASQAPIHEETLMAGLSCGEPSQLAWQVLAEEVSDFMTIPESIVGPAVRLMAGPFAGDPALEAGESAIAGLAGLICSGVQAELRAKLGLDEASRVLLIGSEGVTDRSLFDKLMAEGSD